ncbi:MAG: amino acid ABC transporter substrate-binding protein [Pseudoalteromonas sp.]|nr:MULTISPECIES: transporter substrate-binding domain-containing protein [Pseudoalteromonas]MAD03984.1 amino acid ABC transporter substrate-binding protein [Pseudoalteromonas sp.]RZD20491.1 transporter substrate-binding domain-containing protein [Pseudoalteromonas sp. MEBiC 03485]URQ92851.1 transporter substrate-binding domain-containing protein [Pseudoalteromonas sp. SCSIO 43101]MAE01948.1 amino acid ABC transporter substrate-binding protein [Pseudoalteromonas sp.]MCP4585590.1 amino acid ABC |eukprot:gnl/Carplike_NY0171/8887_a12352_135.p1 GENE.gnl/Carplike_NY0171/8887_a12352_135~~gnl/Carplike_NY0171/8887_a12352_135.p1  ORF type:complete len:251 (-),score=7.57 gnl/Carplike_NY0171/8887_a12352_135:506-1258(-)
MLFVSVKGECLSEPNTQKPIIVAASSSLPPYVIEDTNSGIQLEILKAALKSQGISNIDIHYMSNKRAEQQLMHGKVDIVLNFPDALTTRVYKSDELLRYQNVAVSLANKELKINSIYDLAGKSVLAFQNATNFIEAPFKSVTNILRSYEEVVNQEAQVDHLMKGWVDVIILERRVFLYYFEKYKQSGEVKPFVVHAIFKEAPRPAYFHSKTLKNVFNLGLDEIIESGEYQAIIRLDGTEYAQLLNSKLRE